MKRVFVGLSGGVDSSVAAALLQRQGYDVTGVYMKNWTQDLPGARCPWQQDLNDARAVAARLDIPFKVYDFEAQYRERVVEYLLAEYQAGRTPNPDIMCNQEIKFKLFLEAALADGADGIATGHYARVSAGQLYRSADDNKDQTYFLYRVKPAALRRTLLPVGGYTKPQVRALARQLGLPTAAKKDSQGICFVGTVGIKAFLRQYVAAEPGPIVLRGREGAPEREIGQHDGAIFYTVGQRQGLGVGGGNPFYVTAKDMGSNTVYVTDYPDDLALRSDRIALGDMHCIGDPPQPGKTYQVRTRHRAELVDCEINPSPSANTGSRPSKNGIVNMLTISKPLHALAAGQSAVLYDGERCLGGGVMVSVAVAVSQ